MTEKPKKENGVRLSKWTKQRQMGLAMILLGVLLFVTIVVFLGSQVARVQGLPELLPERETKFFVSFDEQRGAHRGEQRDEAVLYYQKLKPLLLAKAGSLFKIDFKNIESLLTGFGGFAILKPNIPVLLLEIINVENGKSFSQNLSEKEKKNYSLVKNFFVVSDNPEAHEMIKRAVELDEGLATSLPFLQASQTLETGGFASFAFDLSEETSPLFKPFSMASGRLKDNLWHIGAILKERRGNLPAKRYHADLLKLFPASPLLFIGGEDLGARLTFFNRDLSVATRFLRSYGASELSLEKDFLPLVSEEYGFAVFEKNKFLFITTSGKEALPRIEAKLPSILGILMPAVREVTLHDGTKGKELYADLSLIEISHETFGSVKTSVYKMKHKPFELLIAEKNGRIFVGNERGEFSKIINGTLTENLRKSPLYAEKIREVLRGVNELVVVKKEWLESLGVLESLELFFSQSKDIVASTRYTDKLLEIFVGI